MTRLSGAAEVILTAPEQAKYSSGAIRGHPLTYLPVSCSIFLPIQYDIEEAVKINSQTDKRPAIGTTDKIKGIGANKRRSKKWG